MKTHIASDPGLRLSPRGRRLLWLIIIVALLIAVAWALTDRADAADLTGNKGGCAVSNRWTGLTCSVTDAGVGFVSGTCEFGFWFSRVPTARTFRLSQAVTVNGCLGLANELYAPIRITR